MVDHMSSDEIIGYIEELLTPHEGGGPDLHIGFDDATSDFTLSQGGKMLAASRSVRRMFELSKSGERFDR